MWVLGHEGKAGSKFANKLTRNDSGKTFTGAELDLVITPMHGSTAEWFTKICTRRIGTALKTYAAN